MLFSAVNAPAAADSSSMLNAGGWSQVWYDDVSSISEKVQLASQLGLQGVGVWNLDCLEYEEEKAQDETIAMWQALERPHWAPAMESGAQ